MGRAASGSALASAAALCFAALILGQVAGHEEDHDHDDDEPGERTGSNVEAVRFLEANKKRSGVVTLLSGLQYRVVREGNGGYHPSEDSSCDCHYVGTSSRLMPDFFAQEKNEEQWESFDSTRRTVAKQPAALEPHSIVWGQALKMMVEGAIWDIFVPSELIKKKEVDDGEDDEKDLKKSGDVLIFRVELLRIKGQQVPVDICDIQSWKGCSERQRAYVERMQKKTKEKWTSEVERLESMTGDEMTEEDKSWILTRVKLLRSILARDEL